MVRTAESGDAPANAGLLEDLDRFYGTTDFPQIDERISQILSLVFRPVPVASMILACNDGHVVGLASFSFLWPASGTTHSLYLKELYVSDCFPGKAL